MSGLMMVRPYAKRPICLIVLARMRTSPAKKGASGEETEFWRQNCLLRLAKSLEPVPDGAMLCFVMRVGLKG